MLYMTKDHYLNQNFYFHLKFGDRSVRAFIIIISYGLPHQKLALNYYEQKVKIQIKIGINLDCFSNWLLLY